MKHQEGVVRALSDPAFYPHAVDSIEHLQTHISHVFLVGMCVYKLKKAVRFSFLDFSTLERRHHFCLEELRLNRRLCPSVYLRVVAITEDADGCLHLGGSGTVIDYVVQMRRLPNEGMLVNRVAEGSVSAETIEALASRLVAFHDAASAGTTVAAYAAPAALQARWDENLRSIRSYVGRVCKAEEYEIVADFGAAFIREHDALLRARQRRERIRDGHGDLHAGNVCIVESAEGGGPLPPLGPGFYIFDCIEFSEAYRCNDVASDIAFLAMDLEHLGRPDLTECLLTSYARQAADPEVLALFPFYACHRACVRAKVESLKSADPDLEEAGRAAAIASAREHLALGVRYAWRALGPTVIACAGLSGSGKTTLATALAAATGSACLSTDRLRTSVVGTSTEPLGASSADTGIYDPGARQAVYVALCERVERALASRRCVIADATFIRLDDRLRLADVAKRHGAPIMFIDCRADEAVIRHRLEARRTTPSISHARWETYQAQREIQDPFGADEPRIIVDTSRGLEATRADALRRLWLWRRGAGICVLNGGGHGPQLIPAGNKERAARE